jgi:Protein of unknown function (DUF998)
MTTGLVALGVCHIATAGGLTEAGVAARALLAAGGVATIVVAAQPQPAAGHVPAAAVGFVALGLWPAVSLIPDRRISRGVAVFFVALLGSLAVEIRGGHLLGLSERVLAGAEALWPLAVVVSLLARRWHSRPTPPA